MKKKRILVLLGSVVLALLLAVPLVLSCAAPAPSPGPTSTSPPTEAVYEWKLQSYVPAGVLKHEVTIPKFIESVEAASGGRIDITLYPAGALVPALEVFSAVADGTLEMGYSSGAYEMGAIPIAELLFAWPFTTQDIGETMCFLRNLGFMDIARRAYAEYNLYPFAYFSGPYYGDIMSTVPLTSLEDLEGLKIRSWGVYAKMFEAQGAGIVKMAGSEMYTALATGTVDAVTYSPLSVFYDYGLHEVAKYHIGPTMAPVIGCGFLVNLDVWNELPDDLKTIINLAGDEYFLNYFGDFYYRDLEAKRSMLEDYGVTFLEWDDEVIEAFREVAMEVLDEKAATDEYWAEGAKLLKDYMKSLGRM